MSSLTAYLRSPRAWLVLVALLYGAIQFLVMDLNRWFAWDEAIYASEVSRFADAVFLDAHRARGVTLIVAPVLQITDSILATRIYLVCVSSLGLFLSFLPWVRVVGRATPVAAALYASSWLALFYGSEVMPNLYSAMFVVAAIGLGLRYVRDEDQRVALGMIACVAGGALFRPLDAVATVAALTSIWLVVRGRESLRLAVGAAVGFAVGMVPWLVEAWVRFGGPMQRLERIRELVGGGTRNNLLEYLRLLDGPLSAPDPNNALGWPGLVWLAILVGLAVSAWFLTTVGDQPFARATLLSCIWLAVPYLALSEAAAPRFLLPALGLLSLAAGIGLVAIAAIKRAALGWVVCTCVLLAMATLNAGVFIEISGQQSGARARGLLLAEALEVRSEAGGCFFLSSSGFPQISYATGCEGGSLTGDDDRDLPRLERAADEGKQLFLLVNNEERLASLSSEWQCAVVAGLESRNWHVCEFAGAALSLASRPVEI